MVSRVHVSEVYEEDLLVWPFMTDGNYSVKSAYRLLASDEWNANPKTVSVFHGFDNRGVEQRRNRLRERQNTKSLQELGSRAKELIGEYFEANSQPSQHVPRPASVCWCPPLEQHYKGNFDAAFFDALGCAGIGMAFRDHKGTRVRLLLH
ncbi:hypothetical protein CFP56_023879 [Quercus suber]|uniref:Uncharacterized protein n=1 Tax=Quercus suber TaxID=58331 RepID=A0AAW0K969_QUESU